MDTTTPAGGPALLQIQVAFVEMKRTVIRQRARTPEDTFRSAQVLIPVRQLARPESSTLLVSLFGLRLMRRGGCAAQHAHASVSQWG